MRPFLEATIESLRSTYTDLSNVTLILPSKRAGGFLKNYLRNSSTSTYFAPTIVSIEEFIEELSQLSIIDSTELLFKSYEAYSQTDSFQKKEDFEGFASWATTILNDFNEIDRYLVPTSSFFNYLSSIKLLERWTTDKDPSKLVSDFTQFWKQLPAFYDTLQSYLLKENLGYQGMVYRKASEDIEHYLAAHSAKQHVFIGFNALNTAEQQIIQALLENGNGSIYWDNDACFYEDQKHSASHFIRQYEKKWPYLKQHPPQFITNNYALPKNIDIVSIQKNIGQAKYVGDLLTALDPEVLEKTAIVLADEQLLIPTLYALPESVQQINVTMGAPLKSFPAATLLQRLLKLHSSQATNYYYKEVIALLEHPTMLQFIPKAKELTTYIIDQNLSHITPDEIEQAAPEIASKLSLLFTPWQSSEKALLALSKFIDELAKGSLTKMDRIVCFKLNEMFEKIRGLQQNYSHLTQIKTIYSLFNELLATTQLDFEGDAYQGLQIMGLLETRCLDFENIILLSVNEGILPAGKSNASFITYDLKQEYNLPSYTEKDAIYTYHFYRLLTRAKNITLMYNSLAEGLNAGEKSRFLLQLEVEKQPGHHIRSKQITPNVIGFSRAPLSVPKTDAILIQLKQLAKKGFSPSALTSYIRNPIDFYKQKVLGICEFDAIEETVASNTLGTIVHDSLEQLYLPLVNTTLSKNSLQGILKTSANVVSIQFEKSFKGGDYSHGKNLIIFEIAKKYVEKLIQYDMTQIESGRTIEVIAIEAELETELNIPELAIPIKLKGKVDRIDRIDGQTRIIDYKTGRVMQNELEVTDWDDLVKEYSYSKAFQVLTYATMGSEYTKSFPISAGVISFKNMGAGFLSFAKKDTKFSKSKDHIIDPMVLSNFSEALKKLLLELFDPNIPFTDRELDT